MDRETLCFETLLDRGPAHILGLTSAGEVAYGFLASAQGTETFAHKQLHALRGLLGLPMGGLDLGPDYIACAIEDPQCRPLSPTEGLSARCMASLGVALLELLEPLHKRQLFHGAIAGRRVYQSTDGQIFLADCGVVTAAANHHAGEIRLWTPGMTNLLRDCPVVLPELIRGEAFSPRSDVFLIGALLHRLLSGDGPFPAVTTLETYKRIAAGDHQRLDQDEHAEVAPFINAALATLASERPTPAEALELLRPAGAADMLGPLFSGSPRAFSGTLNALPPGTAQKPQVSERRPNTQNLKRIDAQLASMRTPQRDVRRSRRWGLWVAAAFLAAVTWLLLDLFSAELRTRTFDGRQGPALRSRTEAPGPITLRPKIQRRKPEKGQRLPRRDIAD